EIVAIEARQLERVLGIVDRCADQCFGALAHEAGIGAEHQHDRPRRIGPRHEPLDVGAFERDHCRGSVRLYVPATKYEASRAMMLLAITLAARFSASRSPRCRAKRCCWPGMS